MLVNPEVSKVLRATNKAAATLSADSDDTCTRRWTASCPDGELLASLASSHGYCFVCFLLACLASLTSLAVCFCALSCFIRGWDEVGAGSCAAPSSYKGSLCAISCCLLLACFRIYVALHFFHLLLSRDRAGPCAHAQSFVGKSVNDKRAFVEDCNAPWSAHVLRVFLMSLDPDSSRRDIFFSESCCSCIIGFQCVMCMQALPR